MSVQRRLELLGAICRWSTQDGHAALVRPSISRQTTSAAKPQDGCGSEETSIRIRNDIDMQYGKLLGAVDAPQRAQ
jgi:hypothetical protein